VVSSGVKAFAGCASEELLAKNCFRTVELETTEAVAGCGTEVLLLCVIVTEIRI
jgi:hypothetical protein